MSGIYGGERLALMDAESEGQTNGHGSPPPLPGGRFRLVTRSRQIALDGDYAGLTATIRTNVPIGELLALVEAASGGDEAGTMRAFGVMISRLPAFILAWNLDDEEGQPVPITAEAIRKYVPGGLVMELVGKMVETPPIPKA